MKRNVRSETLMRDILSIKEALGVTVCNNILFIHAIAGCDTTSSLFGTGKGTEDFNKMRYNMFCEKLATSQVEPQMLPPTSDAAKYQYERVLPNKKKW